MKKHLLVFSLFFIVFVFTQNEAYPSESIYGHISYASGNPKVIRADNTREDAVVNLPVVPGDVIVTSEESRCEFQFDNGTVMRLDKKTRLKVTTVLAQSLTSKWKITTLELLQGRLYTINQSYNKERFQIITPNAAINLKRNSISTISIRGDDETHIYCDRGKFKVMYGGEVRDLKTETIHKGEGYIVTADHQLEKNGKRNIDFLAWNHYIDRNFKKLHFGISKVPKKILRYNKAIIYWAEKWSSLIGEWVYDDILGYVWKPADEIFAYSARPFFHAQFTRINGKLFLVPSQPWGWAPAHLGTWVWMKWGWTWVPGSTFSCGLRHSIYSWMFDIYGGWDLYYTYRTHGCRAWQDAYLGKYKKTVKKPSFKDVPKDICRIIEKLNKAPVTSIKNRLGKRTPEMFRPKLPVKPMSPKPAVKIGKSSPVLSSIAKIKSKQISKKELRKNVRAYRDWNPDKKWGLRRGVKVHYSSKTNEVVCSELNISSSKITFSKMIALRTSSTNALKKGYSSSSSESSGSSSTSSNSHVSSPGNSGGGHRSGGGSHGSAKKK